MSITLRIMLNGGNGSSSPGLLGWSEKIRGVSNDQKFFRADLQTCKSSKKSSDWTPVRTKLHQKMEQEQHTNKELIHKLHVAQPKQYIGRR